MAFYGVAPVAFESVSAVTATPSVEVGTRRHEGDEHYVYVYNAGNSQISPGYGTTVSGVSGYSVTVSTTTSIDLAIGFVKHATLTTGTYGWLVTQGFTPVECVQSISAGGLLVLAADGKVALKTISTGYVGPVVGKAVSAEASQAAGSCTAYVKCFG